MTTLVPLVLALQNGEPGSLSGKFPAVNWSSVLTQIGVNGSNNTRFINSQSILGFEADLKVVEFKNNGARPQGRLFAALYNDGTGTSTPGDQTGDVYGIVGILEQGSGPQAFYSVTRCTAPGCTLPGEYEILTSGIFKSVGLNEVTDSLFPGMD